VYGLLAYYLATKVQETGKLPTWANGFFESRAVDHFADEKQIGQFGHYWFNVFENGSPAYSDEGLSYQVKGVQHKYRPSQISMMPARGLEQQRLAQQYTPVTKDTYLESAKAKERNASVMYTEEGRKAAKSMPSLY
jgi:hypothetical protein